MTRDGVAQKFRQENDDDDRCCVSHVGDGCRMSHIDDDDGDRMSMSQLDNVMTRDGVVCHFHFQFLFEILGGSS